MADRDRARDRARAGGDAEAIRQRLGLQPHPEGGWYRRTWAAPAADGERPTSTAILYLLAAGERSRWHTVDADEVWCHHAGAPLELSLSDDGVAQRTVVLGVDLAAGEQPQVVVGAGQWQAARPLGGWTLVTCVVAPGFSFDGFTMAPPDWGPGLSGPPG